MHNQAWNSYTKVKFQKIMDTILPMAWKLAHRQHIISKITIQKSKKYSRPTDLPWGRSLFYLDKGWINRKHLMYFWNTITVMDKGLMISATTECKLNKLNNKISIDKKCMFQLQVHQWRDQPDTSSTITQQLCSYFKNKVIFCTM